MNALADPYLIRRFQPEDAPGITALVREIYGEAYRVHPELYDPSALIEQNNRGELVSVVTLDLNGRVVGHYALERPDRGKLAESGEAMVALDWQHHGLMEKMRVLLEDDARRLGLACIYGRCVTNHVFSQKGVEHFGELPCGLTLVAFPADFHAAGTVLNQRMSLVSYLKYLQKPETVSLHLPQRHVQMVERIYQQFAIPLEMKTCGGIREDDGHHEVELYPELQHAAIAVRQVGKGTARELNRLREDLSRQGVKVLVVTLPLAQEGTPSAADALENEGFFFCGILPFHFKDGDALRLQWLVEDLDPGQVQLYNPFARELLNYTVGEWRRVQGNGPAHSRKSMA